MRYGQHSTLLLRMFCFAHEHIVKDVAHYLVLTIQAIRVYVRIWICVPRVKHHPMHHIDRIQRVGCKLGSIMHQNNGPVI